VRIGGLIAIDNVLWSGAVANPKVNDESTKAIRELNELIYKDKRVNMSMLPIGDGLTLARKK
jgi:predicted O-methyltransferase YrrM